MAASVHENMIGTALLDRVAARTSTVAKAPVDQGLQDQSRRARPRGGHRLRDRRAQPAGEGVRAPTDQVESRADPRHPDAPPPPSGTRRAAVGVRRSGRGNGATSCRRRTRLRCSVHAAVAATHRVCRDLVCSRSARALEFAPGRSVRGRSPDTRSGPFRAGCRSPGARPAWKPSFEIPR